MQILLLANPGFSQVIDTCTVNETAVYHVINQNQSSQLYWEVEGGDIISENPSQTDSVEITWNIPGIHEITVYQETPNFCVGELTQVEIKVVESDLGIDLQIPEAFSPNGDSKNNTFVIKTNRQPESFNLKIFNRWGNQLFETANIENQWDGKYKNKDCSDGVYYYILEIKFSAGSQAYKGSVYIKR